MPGEHLEKQAGGESREFGELIRYTAVGYVGGLVLGSAMDIFGFQRSGIGQWLVRTLSGEAESLFEGFYALRQRFRRSTASMAEAYGWGKLLGMAVPWMIDGFSRLVGIDVYGVQGFYIPYFYAMGDQIGANISGMLFLHKESGSWGEALRQYTRHSVMLASLAVVSLVPVGLLVGRLAGFSPTTQIYTALETIAANLCWVPPLIGWLQERPRE